MDIDAFQSKFLACMAFVYLCAMASLYHQMPGLYGDFGILPAAHRLRCGHFTGSGTAPRCVELALLGGMLLAALAVLLKGFRDCATFVVLWMVYFACCQNLDTFLWFQWDILLLEIGFLAIMVAPIRVMRYIFGMGTLPSDHVSAWLVMWLGFRLMFASGVVKLTSECPTWWGLTALHWHFESQCIPNILSWYAHVFTPDWMKSLGVASTYLIEIPLVVWFFSPVRHLRMVTFWAQAFLMILIMATGNYNFFNIAYQIACLPLLIDDGHNKFSISKSLRNFVGTKVFWLLRVAFVGAVYGLTFYWFVRLFDIKVVFGRDLMDTQILSSIAFTKYEFNQFLEQGVPKLMFCAALLFFIQVMVAYIRCFTEYRSRIKTLLAMFGTSVNCFFCMLLFAVSMVPFSTLVPDGANKLIWPEVRNLVTKTHDLQLTHSYGLFRRMTGVGGRPEVVIEGSNNYEGPWLEYEFKYKPTDLHRAPPFLVPHQARLDWQMWFAALGDYRQNPWFLSLMHRLLSNTTEVLDLMEKSPFSGKPPRWVRAVRYTYHFAQPNNEGAWWRREKQEVYCPPFSLEHTDVLDYMRQANLLPFEGKTLEAKWNIEAWLISIISRARQIAASSDPAIFVWSLCSAVICALLFGSRFR